MKFIDELKQNLNAVSDIVRKSQFIIDAKQGRLKPFALYCFVGNVPNLILTGQKQFALAAEESKRRGKPSLSMFYLHRQSEEKGHDLWAVTDLNRLQEKYHFTEPPRLLPSLDRVTGYVTQAIHQEPEFFLAYMLVAEYVTVAVGPEFLSALETQCDIKSSLVSVLGKHIELDQDHVESNLEAAVRLIENEVSHSRFFAHLSMMTHLYVQFLNDIAQQLPKETLANETQRPTKDLSPSP